MTDNGGKQTGNNPPLEGKKRSNIDKGAVFNCKWCKSVNFATAKDFIHIFVFCMDCGKVSVYVKRRTFSGVKNNPTPEGKEPTNLWECRMCGQTDNDDERCNNCGSHKNRRSW